MARQKDINSGMDRIQFSQLYYCVHTQMREIFNKNLWNRNTKKKKRNSSEINFKNLISSHQISSYIYIYIHEKRKFYIIKPTINIFLNQLKS